MKEETLLRVRDLTKCYKRRTSFLDRDETLKAVVGVSFDVRAGETLGLVGESGSGKSTLGRLILNLEPADSGKVFYRDMDLAQLSERKMRLLRQEMQIIFQDPYSSLNPRKTVRQTLEEPLRLFDCVGASQKIDELLSETLERVGLHEKVLDRYPHEFSGGQRQRIGIARAILLRPKFIVCDEPVSSLDVSVQAQILNLLQDLQDDFGFTYLFISHDLRVIRHLCHRVMVMFQGQIVESGSCDRIFESPECEYTKKLIAFISSTFHL